jgi:hypothetical protein
VKTRNNKNNKNQEKEIPQGNAEQQRDYGEEEENNG